MDAKLTLKIPKNLTFQQGATIGGGTYTASLGLFTGLHIKVPDLSSPILPKDEWIVIFGGAGSIGQYSIQIAKILGYKVVATCSRRTADLVKSLGADAIIDYSKSPADQLQDLKTITGGNFFGVYDTVAKSESLARQALTEVSVATTKYYATTDEWSPMENHKDHETYRAKLGLLGRTGDDIKTWPTINEEVASFIPFLSGLLESGKLRPNEVKVVGSGLASIPPAIEAEQKGASSGAKIVVELQAS